MKLLKVLPAAAVLYVLFLSGSTTLTSCTKDTVHDTVIIKDTSCHLYAGLVGYYNFTNGNLNDSSGYRNNIVFSNATKTADRFGKPNNAYLFNGSDNYMQIKNHASLNPSLISLVAVFKTNDFYRGLCHANQLVGKGTTDVGNGGYGIRYHDVFNDDCSAPVDTTTEFLFGVYGNDINSEVTTAAASTHPAFYMHSGNWYTVIFTYDGTDARIYVNGALKGTRHITATFYANNDDVFIGKHDEAIYPYWFNGILDELRIYNRALNENEVKQLSSLKQ